MVAEMPATLAALAAGLVPNVGWAGRYHQTGV